MPLKSGEVFAGYVIERIVGSGGMGEVYLARHPRLPRLDALKILPAALTNDAGYRQRFNREADLAASLWHPHIIGIHDRGEFDGQLWISMDYVNGTDAGRLLMDRYPNGMPEQEVREIVTAVAEALDFAHRRRLLHRDVKPSNILLTESGEDERRILLADFGIARQADDVSGLTGTNMTVGSVAYAAPEQLMGEEVDGRADEYALAATAFHLLSGAPPFPHSNPAVVISKQLNTPAPSLAEHRPELANFDTALSKALAKDRAYRYPRCLDFAQALGQQESRTPTRAINMQPEATRRLRMPSGTAAGAPVPSQQRAAAPPPVAAPPTVPLRESPAAATSVPPPRPAPSSTPAVASSPKPPVLERHVPAVSTPSPRPTSSAPPPADTPPYRRDTGAPRPAKAVGLRSDRLFRQGILVLLAVLLLIAAVLIGAIAYWNHTRSNRGTANSMPKTTSDATAAPVGSTLQPDPKGFVFIATKSGRTHCQISKHTVVCAAQFTNSPVVNGQHANEVNIKSNGSLLWGTGQIDAPSNLVTLDYQTYHAVGWTISATKSNTRFTNDTTGHGMSVSVDKVESF